MLEFNRGFCSVTVLPLLFAAGLLSGCVVGGPQVGPRTAGGHREHTVSSKSDGQGHVAAEGYVYVSDEQFEDDGDFGLGVMLGARAGATSIRVADAPSSAVGLADEAHTDFIVTWKKFGVGVEGALGAEAATVKGVQYSIGGWGASMFGQYSIVQPLFLTAGIGKQFGTVSRRTDEQAALDKDISADANLIRVYGGVSWIFSDSPGTQWGVALQLRHTASGAAMANKLDLSWKSTGLLGEIMYLKF